MWVKVPAVEIPDDVVVSIGLNGQQYHHDKKINSKDIENTYTYYSRPIITHYKPKTGHSKGNTVMTVYGRGFTPYRDDRGNIKKEPMYVRMLEYPQPSKKKLTIIGG